ncbi:MAG: putative addiction module antidote protein [Desulfobacteraceae bacterium 4572_19]|nr:MAG: putative addiction module antidote protein [Desulfobacteraceae bacterium 4572_19]
MKITTSKWDPSKYLDTPEMVRDYLKISFEDGDTEQLIMAIANVAKAQDMSEIARKTNLSRQNLSKALSANSSPKFDTIKRILDALGCKLAVA